MRKLGISFILFVEALPLLVYRASGGGVVVNVLDIDIDFFVDPHPIFGNRKGRLSSADFHAWRPVDVERYLQKQCGLSADKPIPGKVVEYHHELYDIWDRLIDIHMLDAPFSITHIDSHADLGLGDGSSGYILCDLIHNPVGNRQSIKREEFGGLLEGNYLAFALARRWIRDIKYVQHPQTRSRSHGHLPDISDALFKGNGPNCETIQLRAFPRGSDNGIDRFWQIHEPIALEPEVPIQFFERDTFRNADAFSFLFVAQSPNYTPEAADSIIPVFQKYIDPI